MKKLLVAALVLVTVFAYAKPKKEGTATYVTDVYEYYNGVFEMTQDGSLTFNYKTNLSEQGQNSEISFAYYKLEAYTDESGKEIYKFTDPVTLDASIPKDGHSATIENLKKGDISALSVDPKNFPMVYSTFITEEPEVFERGADFHHDSGETFHFSKDNGNNGNTKVLGFSVSATAAPSGQPLPGALTTMLIAGGCAAFLKRKKSARK